MRKEAYSFTTGELYHLFIYLLRFINNLSFFIVSTFHGMDVPQFVHLWKDTWAISSFWLLLIKLLWTFMHRFLYEQKFSCLWDKCPRVHFLDPMYTTSLNWNAHTLWLNNSIYRNLSYRCNTHVAKEVHTYCSQLKMSWLMISWFCDGAKVIHIQ